LIDGDLSNRAKNKDQDEEDEPGLKKLDRIEAISDKKERDKSHTLSIKSILITEVANLKQNHSWDNLVDKNNDLDLGLIPGAKKSGGTAGKAERKDLGEITIDDKS